MASRFMLSLLLLAAAAVTAALGTAGAAAPRCPGPPGKPSPLNATESGFIEIDTEGSRFFFVYYEASGVAGKEGSATADNNKRSRAPIILWLQGGPGCSSLFGALYELGPQLVDARLGLRPNPGSWGERAALLFVDQPLGVGFSAPGRGRGIPTDEVTLAADLYAGLQAFFRDRPHLRPRPLVIAGESYAGKYVPSIGHFILSQTARLNSTRSLGRLARTSNGGSAASTAAAAAATGAAAWLQQRNLPATLAATRPLLRQPPLFELAGLAIGNGLTDPAAQVMTHADTAHFMGYLDKRQRLQAMAMQLQTLQLVAEGQWEAAHAMRSRVLEHVRQAAGVATLLDMRRYEDYDASHLVDCYLNLPAVKEGLGVDPAAAYESCSPAVGAALGPDVMRSVAGLVPDLLAAYPLLLYQGKTLCGMHDAQDGPASSEAWICRLDWDGGAAFATAKRHIIRATDVEAAAATLAPSIASRMSSRSSGEASSRRLRAKLQLGEAAPLRLDRQEAGGERSAAGAATEAAEGRRVVAYWKRGGGLTHVVLTQAGHMVPRDAPAAARWMLHRWLEEELGWGG